MENKQPSHEKFFGLFLIVTSLIAVFFLYQPELTTNKKVKNHKTNELNKAPVKTKLQTIWEKDIKMMSKEKLFHKEIGSLKKVRVFLLDESLHKHFKGLKAPFKINRSGENFLEISFMSHHSENDDTDKLIIQYNLTDVKSHNMFWEYSRTVDLEKNILN